MSDDRTDDAVQRVLRLLADRLDQYLEGDELALETLGETFEQNHIGPDDLQATALVLRSMSGAVLMDGEAALDHVPGQRAQRVLSAEERDRLSPEAWGTLLDLKRRGQLDSGQFERVLEWLGGCGVRPVGAELALEVATRVALGNDAPEDSDGASGDFDLAH